MQGRNVLLDRQSKYAGAKRMTLILDHSSSSRVSPLRPLNEAMRLVGALFSRIGALIAAEIDRRQTMQLLEFDARALKDMGISHADVEGALLEFADGAGLATFLRTLAGSFAASLTTWIWNRRATMHHAYLTENISQYDPATRATVEQLGGPGQHSAALLERMAGGTPGATPTDASRADFQAKAAALDALKEAISVRTRKPRAKPTTPDA